MLMNFEPLSYDTLKFQGGAAEVKLSGSESGDQKSVSSILSKNEKLNSIVTNHLTVFPLFNKVVENPTDKFYFKIKKQAGPTTHELHVSVSNPSRIRVVIEIESGAEVTLNETAGGEAYLGYQLDLIVGEGAKVNVISALKAPVLRTILRNAYMKKDASLVWHEAVIEGTLIQSHTRTYFCEPGSRAEVKDLFALSSDTVLDMYHSMYHLASYTKSDMLTKGVLDKKSRAMYQGLIHIDEQAVGCVGYQKQDSLILSNSAEVNAVPNLEIENSDVKCSHGVTTAHIDKEKLFYAESRGIDETTATGLFVDGHLSACIDAISDEVVKKELQERIHENLRS